MNLPPYPRAEDRFPKVDRANVYPRIVARELFEMGLSYKAVSKELGLSVWTVRDWHRDWKKGRFNVVPTVRPYLAEFRERVLREVNDPKRILAVAKHWDVPYITLKKWYEKKLEEERLNEQNLQDRMERGPQGVGRGE